MARIIGNTTATPNPRPDWLQTDETKADYIKNKPDIPSIEGLATETFVEEKITEITLSKGETSGSGNVVTDISVSGHEVTLIKGEVFIPESEKGAANGVATLDESGRVPSTQLPSYAASVIEGYINDDKTAFYSDEDKTKEITAESGRIYVDIASLRAYRWGGSIYAEISESVALGETASTAYYGDKGKVAYDHSLITGENPHGITKDMLGVVETYSNDEPLLGNIGGILASNHRKGFNNVPITDLITELLYPYMAPVINSFSLSPSAGAKEMNVKITVNTATVNVAKRSKTLQSINLYKGSELVESKTEGVASGGTFIFTINETLDGSADTTYKVRVVEAGENGDTIPSGDQTYDFVYPYFYGVVSRGVTVDSATVLGFTKSIRAKGSHSYSYTTDNQCPVIAYLKSYGPLKSIIDPNNFTQDWTQSTVTVDNGSTINGVDYYVYVGGAATATATYKFNY